MDGGAWWAAVHGVTESQTRLHFHFSLSCIGEGNGNPLQCSCLEKPRVRGAWWAAVYGVAQSRTRLKRLSSSSSCCFYVRIGQSSQVGPLLAYRMDPILTFSSTCSTQLVGALRLALNRSRMLGLGSRAGWLRPRKGLSHRTGR